MEESGTRGRLDQWRDALRANLWPLPIAAVLLALACGVGLPRVDAHIDGSLPEGATTYLFGGGADAARTVLSAIAGSLITVTSLTFSLTVVTLQLASSQFSPRLLRTFTRDRFVHLTLALFLATFVYALTVLRTVRTAGQGQVGFVPQVSVTTAFVLALASVTFLVLFLAHLVREIRVETMLSRVRVDASEAQRRVVRDGSQSESDLQLPVQGAAAMVLVASSSGFLVRVDEEALLTAATDADAVVRIDREPGSFLVAGTPIGSAWRRDGAQLDDDARQQLTERAGAALATGTERTAVQDVAFGLRQITDVAIKALSPGINDPTTAVHALGHASALLCELAGCELGTRLLEADGTLRVGLAGPRLADLIDLAVSQPRRYGAADPAVLARLLLLLSEVGWHVGGVSERAAIAGQLARLRRTAVDQDFDDAEQAGLDALARHVERAVAGRGATAPTASAG